MRPGFSVKWVPDDVLLSHGIHRTIIGAEAFHGPVRNGKEWDHLAMVVRRSLLSAAIGPAAFRRRSQSEEVKAFDCILANPDSPEPGKQPMLTVIGSSRTGN